MKKALLFPLILSNLCASDFPVPYNSEPDPSGPMPAAEAVAKMRLLPGFKATVFAAEPDVQNPIAMAWDARGRLWVAENYTYAEPGKKFDLNLRDRILIFEDRDGDGHFDTRKVFTDEPEGLYGMVLNMRREPFSDVRVRKALALLLNRDLLIKQLFFNEYVPMISYFHRLSITGLSANVIVIPLLSLVVPLGFASMLTMWHPLAAVTRLLLVSRSLAYTP